MPYILYKTNGNTLVTVDDGSVDNSTSLTFVGRNYSGYGQVQNENFAYLLENFANPTAPLKPVQGQLWFNSTTGKQNMNFCYNGSDFKSLANLANQSTDPSLNSTLLDGDLWWDGTTNLLKSWSTSLASPGWITIGPSNSITSVASWQAVTETDALENSYNLLKGYIGYDPVVVVSNAAFTPRPSSDLFSQYYNGVKPGITLKGANAIGSTRISEYYLWGTASEALTAVTATNVTVATATTGTYFVPFVGTTTISGQQMYSTSSLSYNVFTGVMNATATSAQYADLAERYEADAVYEVGTVLVIGGEKEVTVTTIFADTRVAGVVSANPAYMMNSDAGNDETHPYIALKGRVPCKVQGYIKKGDLIVTSSTPGYGIAASSVFGGAIIGKALGSQSEGFGVIEVLVV
jgi:hypothetical protein